LIEADMDAGHFEYAFDKIGNRITRHLDSSLLSCRLCARCANRSLIRGRFA
jgi:hypothetical protein